MTTLQFATAPVLQPPAAGIPPSCSYEVFRTVDSYERDHQTQAIRLHVGEPDFRAPASAIDAVTFAVHNGRTRYTAPEGLPELRAALVEKLRTHNGHDTDTDLVFVTPGSTQGLLTVMHAVAAPGSEILLPSVHWPVHLQQSLLAGLRPTFYPLDERMRPDVDALARITGGRPRVLLVNSPNNPSGAVCDEDHLMALLKLARSRGWLIISDEAYEDFLYGTEHVSLARLERDVPPVQRRVFSAFSFSKSYGMTGWRLGYVTAPNQQHAATMRAVQEASIACPPEPMQLAGIAALGERHNVVRNVELVRRNRNIGLRPLLESGLLAWLPEGGWYAVFDCLHTGLDAATFAARLLREQAVALAPAYGFALRPTVAADGRVLAVHMEPSARGLLRLAMCCAADIVDEGVRRIVDFARGL